MSFFMAHLFKENCCMEFDLYLKNVRNVIQPLLKIEKFLLEQNHDKCPSSDTDMYFQSSNLKIYT